MANPIPKQISRPVPSNEAIDANSTTGGPLLANCNLTGGTLDIARNALMNKGIASEVPLGLKVIVSINAGLNIVGGSIQVRDGVRFLRSAFKTEWVFGKQFGFARIGTGFSLFCGGILTLIQRIYEALLATSKAAATTGKHVLGIVGKWGPIAYMTMFVVLIGMCALISFKERGLRNEFDQYDSSLSKVQTHVGTLRERFTNTLQNLRARIGIGTHTPLDESSLNEPVNLSNAQSFLEELRDNTFGKKERLHADLLLYLDSSTSPDSENIDTRIDAHRGKIDPHLQNLINEWDTANNKINELTMLAGKKVMTALETGGEAIQDLKAINICKQLDKDLTEKKYFFTLLGIVSVISILVMVGSLILTGPVWAAILLGIGIALTAFFTMGNIKSMQMTLREVKGNQRDRMTVYFVAGLIAAVGGIAIILSILNPVSLIWIVLMTAIILGLEALQVYQLCRMKQNSTQTAARETISTEPVLA